MCDYCDKNRTRSIWISNNGAVLLLCVEMRNKVTAQTFKQMESACQWMIPLKSRSISESGSRSILIILARIALRVRSFSPWKLLWKWHRTHQLTIINSLIRSHPDCIQWRSHANHLAASELKLHRDNFEKKMEKNNIKKIYEPIIISKFAIELNTW